MNKIEQLHLEAIQTNKAVRRKLCVNNSGTSGLEKNVASKSAEITEQIAVAFIQWAADNSVSLSAKRRDSEQFFYQGKEIPPEHLFQEFLKTKVEYISTTKLLVLLEEDACGSNDYDTEMINGIKVELDKRNELTDKNPIPLNK